jgi:hypothetical protein
MRRRKSRRRKRRRRKGEGGKIIDGTTITDLVTSYSTASAGY